MRFDRRKILFRAVLVLTPFLLLLLLEGCLRLAGLFASEPIVVEVPGSDGKSLTFNAHAGIRYFNEKQTAVPMLTPEVFPRIKAPGTFRVLCLGESSTAGFPFDCQVPFPWQLGRILKEAYPDRKIEVLNAGMAAISSYVIVDMLPELLDIEPDLVLVYAGHNEFYGVFGSATALSMGGSDMIVRSSLAVQKTRIGQMVRRTIDALRPAPPETTATRVLMQRVVGDNDIPYGSDRYARTMEGFRKNLGRIADACAARHVPVVFATLVSNQRDQPPFKGTADGILPRVRESLEKGARASGEGDRVRAAAAFTEALTLDPGNADALYGSARVLMVGGDTAEAKRWFGEAVDHDRMRFRASAELNDIIAATAREKGAGLVDFADILSARSPGRIIGNEWICDHLHPNPQGYYMLAVAFYVSAQRIRALPAPAPDFRLSPVPYGVTPLDWEIGLMKVFPIVHRWPFREQDRWEGSYQPAGDSSSVRIAREYLTEHNIWTRAHADMARSYVRNGNPAAARRECEAIALFAPTDPWPYVMMADIYRTEGQWKQCADALQGALGRPGPQGMLQYELGQAHMKLGDTRSAIRAMAAASEAPEFTPEERANARFHLAGLFSDAGRPEEAGRVLRRLLADLPGYEPARILLNRIEGTHR
jgi:tetratricopeptide (TPR) repeat protein